MEIHSQMSNTKISFWTSECMKLQGFDPAESSLGVCVCVPDTFFGAQLFHGFILYWKYSN